MAVHLGWPGYQGGNDCVTLGGEANASSITRAWTPSFAGATAFSTAFTIKPDAGAIDNMLRSLCHCGNSGSDNQVFWIRYRGDAAPGLLDVIFYDENWASRTAYTPAGVLVSGAIHCIVVSWRASDQTIKMQINDVDVPLTLGGAGIPHIRNNQQAVNAPLELGAQSGMDQPGIAGVYQQWGIWNTFLTDAQRLDYGTYGDLTRMPVGLQGVTLARDSIAPIDPAGTYDGEGAVGHLHDLWTGFHYGGTMVIYNYGGGDFLMPFQGVFGGWSLADDLVIVPPAPVASYVPHLIEDYDALPKRGFAVHELIGHGGKRTNVTTRGGTPLGSKGAGLTTGAAIQAAMNAAQLGDDVYVRRASGAISGSLYIPGGKTVDANTPRQYPSGMTRLSGGTPLS